MFEHQILYDGESHPAELLIGQGTFSPVEDWIEVWNKLGEATRTLPWGNYVAWVLLDQGGEPIAASADSRDTFIARYGSGPGKLEVIYGL